MGCGGCELWPTCAQVRNAVLAHLEEVKNKPVSDRQRECVVRIIREAGDLPTDLYHRRLELAAEILKAIQEAPVRE